MLIYLTKLGNWDKVNGEQIDITLMKELSKITPSPIRIIVFNDDKQLPFIINNELNNGNDVFISALDSNSVNVIGKILDGYDDGVLLDCYSSIPLPYKSIFRYMTMDERGQNELNDMLKYELGNKGLKISDGSMYGNYINSILNVDKGDDVIYILGNRDSIKNIPDVKNKTIVFSDDMAYTNDNLIKKLSKDNRILSFTSWITTFYGAFIKQILGRQYNPSLNSLVKTTLDSYVISTVNTNKRDYMYEYAKVQGIFDGNQCTLVRYVLLEYKDGEWKRIYTSDKQPGLSPNLLKVI